MAHIHILGICGTFMGSIARIAAQMGHRVTGCDENVYPPMSTQLEKLGIQLYQGFDVEQLKLKPDYFIIGNTMKRGMPIIEAILANNLPYQSAPEWLYDNVLKHRWVLAVAGTHGKTTTTSMLAWILQSAGKNPGFLIGGVPKNFEFSAELGGNDYFVIEADEYDTAFFDKRAKLIHYRPKTFIINNLEYDHADIYTSLSEIQRQFHYALRMVPNNGLVIHPKDDSNIQSVLEQGCWTPLATIGYGADWSYKLINLDGSQFEVFEHGVSKGFVNWSSLGLHNVSNALSAIAAANHIDIKPSESIKYLSDFQGVKRRLDVIGSINNTFVYDDFAHHPTAIATTLSGLRARIGDRRLIVLLDLASHTMRMGVHRSTLAQSLETAQYTLIHQPEAFPIDYLEGKPIELFNTLEPLWERAITLVQPGDHIVIMSNRGFGNIHQRLIAHLKENIHGAS